jgi:radical SAM protein with 4Fe4S-binding SPASM domain
MITKHIDAATKCSAECLVDNPPPPHSAKIELVRSCNFKCSFCYHMNMNDQHGHMDMELYRRIVKELGTLGIKDFAPFFYGESFMSKHLVEAIRIAKNEGFARIFLTTNGSLANEDKVKACMEAGLNSLKFSLNYADEAQFAETTGVKGSVFGAILKNIQAARKVRDEDKYDCGLYASYIRYDDKQRERMQPLLTAIGPYLDELYALPIYGKPTGRNTGGNTGRADNPVAGLPCWAIFRSVHINYDGTVNACCFNTEEPDFIMGDLKTQSFMDIWHGEKFRALRRAHLAKDVTGTACASCVK